MFGQTHRKPWPGKKNIYTFLSFSTSIFKKVYRYMDSTYFSYRCIHELCTWTCSPTSHYSTTCSVFSSHGCIGKSQERGNGTRWNRESNYLSVDVWCVSPWTSRWLECSGCKAQNERKSKFVHFQVTVYACNFRMNRFYLCKDICSLCPADSAWKRMLI